MTQAKTHHRITLSILAGIVAFFWWAGQDLWTRSERIMAEAQKVHDEKVLARCYVHGDYNMADAWCRYQAEGMKQ